MNEITFSFGGFEATVIRPEQPNGEWIWKTEFFHAFEAAEVALSERGYTRVYYRISNQYGSYRAVRLMHAFHRHVTEAFSLKPRCHLFGFSRGGLYAFNFALTYPEYVRTVYLDAPVLDMRSWPPRGSQNREEVYQVFGLNEETIERFDGHPIENLAEFAALGLPTLLVAGDADEIVPLPENGGRMIDYYERNGLPLTYYVKPGCGHHPHSLEDDVTPIVTFIEEHSDR